MLQLPLIIAGELLVGVAAGPVVGGAVVVVETTLTLACPWLPAAS